VKVSLKTVSVVYTDVTLKSLVPLDREPSVEECGRVDAELLSKHPLYCRRGKYLYGFFTQWLDALAEARRSGDASVFSDGIQRRGYAKEKVNLSALAALSKIPDGLAEFVAGMVPTGT
jgi:hypothetical protein